MHEPKCPLERFSTDLPAGGRVLVLRKVDRDKGLESDAIYNALLQSPRNSTPFVGLLIHQAGVKYRISDNDIGAIVEPWLHGQNRPCAIVVTGAPAVELKRVLGVTKMDVLPQLRLVETEELGMKPLSAQLGIESA